MRVCVCVRMRMGVCEYMKSLNEMLSYICHTQQIVVVVVIEIKLPQI